MNSELSSEWCAVFIDGGYLGKVLKSEFKEVRIDFLKLSERICPGKRLRTYYYNAPPYQSNPPTPAEKERYFKAMRFFNHIDRLERFEVVYGKTVKRYTSEGKEYFTQKGVDVRLAVDLVRLSWAGHIKIAVLIAGDNDFVPAVKAAKDAGVIVKLYYSRNNSSEELISAVDEAEEITRELINECKRY
ncbi:NYN domain-containing protein [Thermococcus sp.]|uniref:NYN domain-containing protein n=1 Tax=Thermococcus sp. TaxID=35749 RepID=UPI00261BB9C5|nr:NYN domain-containing protein [Thermococcus sp.]